MNMILKISGLVSLATVMTAMSGCGTALPQRDRNPELARTRGYFVSADEAKARGGVARYVPQYCSQGGWGLPASCGSEIPSPKTASAPVARDSVVASAAAPAPAQPALIKVYFDSGKATLSGAEARRLRQWADSYRKNAGASSLQIQGFADSRGNADRNAALSARRAEATASALRAAGLNAKASTINGMGEVAESDSASLAREARRVELVLQ